MPLIGNESTISEVLTAIERQSVTVVVVIDGSGKAADLLAYTWKLLYSTECVVFALTNSIVLSFYKKLAVAN